MINSDQKNNSVDFDSILLGKFMTIVRAYGTPEKIMLPVMFMLSPIFHILAGFLHIDIPSHPISLSQRSITR